MQVRQSALFALLLGGVAVLAGLGGIANAVITIRRRTEMGPTYGTLGGPVYSATQFGCAGVLIAGGLALAAFALFARG